MSRSRAALAAAPLVLGAALASSCGGGSVDPGCSTLGCVPVATIKVDLPLAFGEVQKSTITVCHNGTCLAGSFATLNAPPSPNAGVEIGIASAPDGGAASFGTDALVMANTSGALWLQVFWRSNVDDVADGDTYSVTVQDSSGQSVVSFTGTAMTYDTVFPNGKDCAPTCRHVEFDQHTS